MPAFDRSVWESRTYDRKRSSGTLVSDLEAIDGIVEFERWLKNKRWTLTFGNEPNGICLFNEKNVSINSRCRPSLQLVWLIHECGHVLIEINRAKTGAPHPRGPAQTFDEELDAWLRGERLARRLKVSFERGIFLRRRRWALATYLR